MQEDSIIQKTLFAIDYENNEQKDIKKNSRRFVFGKFKKRIAKKTETKKKFN